MAEIMANTLDRYLIGITTDFLLAEVLIHMLFSNSHTSVYQFSIWLQFSNATFWEHAHTSTRYHLLPHPSPLPRNPGSVPVLRHEGYTHSAHINGSNIERTHAECSSSHEVYHCIKFAIAFLIAYAWNISRLYGNHSLVFIRFHWTHTINGSWAIEITFHFLINRQYC